jgi:hypothetical protein
VVMALDEVLSRYWIYQLFSSFSITFFFFDLQIKIWKKLNFDLLKIII